MSDDFFAPPPFKPDEALQRLQRELRALGLTEREGRFERRGQPIARVALDGAELKAARVRQPARTPQWQERVIKDSAALRDFVAELKRELARWGDRDE
ncbi:hypothetical protein [Azohydromonas caseinilytica]|uniref:Uncharacterized protein n=1 Tax=Azohydromonas caseinilytica TaxID=2728836 RepID=A0A848F4G1_9BURK|nr:hypothetical protein [Azohydromonas caseinilytica]NML13486.1 hypothetical protein [Azohydromonas caseinilytica]